MAVEPSPNRGQRFPKRLRIRRRVEFQQVFDARQRFGDAHIVLFVVANGQAFPRLGVSVPKRLGGAVVRNHWKRVVREAFRQCQDQFAPGWDYVVVPRGGNIPKSSQLQVELLRLARRAIRKSSCSRDVPPRTTGQDEIHG